MEIFQNRCVTVFLLVCIVCMYTSYCQQYFDMSSVEVMSCNCDGDVVFRNLFDVPVHTCIVECRLRSRCHHILYKGEGINHCGLIANTNLELERTFTVSQCIYVNVDNVDFNVNALGDCADRPCSLTQRCSPEGFTHICEESECMEPPEIEFGTPYSKALAVGDRNSYHCDYPRVLDGPGDLFITCLPEGRWSDPGLVCSLGCRRTFTHLANSDLAFTSNVQLTVGTTLTYDCNSVYSAVSQTDTFTCEADAEWDHRIVRCCRGGYELFAKYCVKLKVTNSTSETFDDMERSCTEEGSSMYGVGLGVAEFMLKKYPNITDTIGFRRRESDIVFSDMSVEDQICLYNITELTEATLTTTDIATLLGYARRNDAPCKCEFAESWNAHEPTNADEECLATTAAHDYLLADVDCTGHTPPLGFVCYEYYNIY